MSSTDWTSDTAGAGQYAAVNGIELYYEMHGTGRPLVLLHGGLGSGEMFGPVLPAFAGRAPGRPGGPAGPRPDGRHRPAPRRAAHGRRRRGPDRPPRARPGPTSSATRSAAGSRLQTAVQHPEKVGRLVVVSAHIRRDAIYPEMLAQQGQVNAAAAEFMKDTPMYELYQRVAPRPEDFPRLLDKIGAAMARTSTSPRRCAGCRCRRWSRPPTPTWRRRATTSRCSSCSTAGSATAAGWGRAGRPAGTRSRSCRA